MTAVDVGANVRALHERIARAGGEPSRVRVVAVTKGLPLGTARSALAAGLVDLGESYAQELVGKAEALLEDRGDLPAPRWHFIGRLQRNKVRLAAPFVSLWQSIDRLSVAAEVARRAPGAAVLVQVNVSEEPAKGGCRPEFTASIVEGCRDLGLAVRGLMAVGRTGAPEDARAGFRLLRELADRLELPERSMGMSDDLDVAVQEGATIVRVGTALLGARPLPRHGPTSEAH